MEKKRVLFMDIAKAIGILIVLLVHAELHLGPVTFFGGMFYMPVFFVLAGMTFSYRPEEKLSVFLKKKAKRLLLPYLGYNGFLFTFFFVKDSMLSGQLTGKSFFPLLGILYSRNCLLPMGQENNVFFMQILNAPTWFLTGLFVTLFLFWVLVRMSKGDRKKLLLQTGRLLAVAILVHYFCPVLLPWSVDCALYAVAFLTFGKFAAEYGLVGKLYGSPLWTGVLLVGFLGLSLLNGSVNMSIANYGHSMLLYLIVGALGSLLCMIGALFLEKHAVWLGKPLAWLGRHTIPVLCLHLFVYAMMDTLFRALK